MGWDFGQRGAYHGVNHWEIQGQIMGQIIGESKGNQGQFGVIELRFHEVPAHDSLTNDEVPLHDSLTADGYVVLFSSTKLILRMMSTF